MSWIRVLLSRCSAFFRRKKLDADLDEELRAHLELAVEEYRAQGMSEEQARAAALRAFGGVTQTRESYRVQRGLPWLEQAVRDIRYAVRQLRKTPVFAITTILTLALGIGATTAIFSVMNAVLLRMLPVANPDQVFYLHVPDGQPYGAHNTGDSETSFSLPVFNILRKNRHAFSDVMAFAPLGDGEGKVAIRFGNGLPEEAAGDMVSGNFFSGLGVSAGSGHLLTMADEDANAPVAVLSYAYWTSRFSRNPDVIGQTMYIKGIPFTIAGVAAAGFPGVEQGVATDLWIPLQRRPELSPWGSDQTLYGSPDWWCLRVLARLAPGVSAQQAIAEVSPSFQAEAYARIAAPNAAHPRITLSAVAAKGLVGLGDLNEYGQRIKILMALVLLVLVIACSNVAMLIVARNAARQRDFSLRLALGAGRSALLRQLLVESGILVVAGSVSGWIFGLNATRALALWAHLEMNLAPDWKVLLFTSTISVLAALVFTLAPLRTATNAPVTGALRSSAATSYQSKRGGSVLLAAQIALCFTLLTSAGLLLRTLLNYEHTNLGMQTRGLLVFGIAPQKQTTDEAKLRFYRALLERMRSLPGVESATLVGNRLGSGWSSNDEPTVDGITYPFSQVPLRTNVIGPDYLRTLGIPLLEGRDLRDSDTATSEHVVVVNETFVKKLLPNTNPIGHQLGDLKKEHYTIVGVAKDSKYRSVDEAPRAMAYYPYTQSEDSRSNLQVELRIAGNPMALLPTVERAVRQMDADLPLEKPMTQSAVFEDSYAQQRLFSRLAMFFALLAALLVGVGLYGTLAYRTNRKSAEIGVRMALGASRSQVLYLVLREAFQIAVVGLTAGIPLALLAGHFMGSMLYELQPYDHGSLFGAVLGITGISLLAGWIPAQRAASINPVQALRSE